MSIARLTQVLLRLWGLSLLIDAASAFPSHLILLASSPWEGEEASGALMRASQLGSVGGLLLTAVAGVILLVYAPAIASRLTGGDETVTASITARDAFLVGAVLLGIVFLIAGAQHLVTAAYTLAARPSWDETRGFEYVWQRHEQTIPASVVQVLAGVLLLARRRAWADRWFPGE